jgi:tRNA A58 N-methylase Trm61
MREIYFKIKQNCELPVAMLNYTYKDFDGVIHPFDNIFVDFKEDEKNIEKMESVKKKYGQFFMFFNNSDEGIEFWKNNPITIVPKL